MTSGPSPSSKRRARNRSESAALIRELSFSRDHIRGLDENICNAFAPNPCAISRDSGNVAGDRSVNSDASTAIHPGRRARRRNRFRAVFILVFVGGYYVLWFFGHSLRISRKANGERRNQAAQNSVTEFSKRRKRSATGFAFGLVGPALCAGYLRARYCRRRLTRRSARVAAMTGLRRSLFALSSP